LQQNLQENLCIFLICDTKYHRDISSIKIHKIQSIRKREKNSSFIVVPISIISSSRDICCYSFSFSMIIRPLTLESKKTYHFLILGTLTLLFQRSKFILQLRQRFSLPDIDFRRYLWNFQLHDATNTQRKENKDLDPIKVTMREFGKKRRPCRHSNYPRNVFHYCKYKLLGLSELPLRNDPTQFKSNNHFKNILSLMVC
jgi:hypothetical protein